VTSLVAAASTGSSSDDLKVFRSLLSGSDRITGGSYGDKLEGFGGNDVLYGRQGADRLYGGAGADAFTFKSARDSTVDAGGRDTIQDFSAAQKDRVDLRAIDANTTVGGNQAFSFIG
jgi:Ca2+-binding RTX toxin-like protein